MNCHKCLSNSIVKNGLREKLQCFLCKECGFQFTKEQVGKSIQHKRLAIELYLEGLTLRQIGEIINADHSTVYHWLHEFGELLDNVRNTQKCKLIASENIELIQSLDRKLIINVDSGASLFFQQLKEKV